MFQRCVFVSEVSLGGNVTCISTDGHYHLVTPQTETVETWVCFDKIIYISDIKGKEKAIKERHNEHCWIK